MLKLVKKPILDGLHINHFSLQLVLSDPVDANILPINFYTDDYCSQKHVGGRQLAEFHARRFKPKLGTT